jgi:mono/diheme cytochrome c family protein
LKKKDAQNQDTTSTIEVFLDEASEPIARYTPPGRFELDTTSLQDGPHEIRIVATDPSGAKGFRKIPFEVRNGPGIDIDGLRENDVVQGKINVLINSFSATYEGMWEPIRAETPAPVPIWTWMLIIFIAAWAMFYGLKMWTPTSQFAKTPTYEKSAFEATLTARETGPSTSSESLGAQLYRTSCSSCHKANGQGIADTFPPLAGDTVVTADNPTEHIEVVLFGKKGSIINGIQYQAHMPSWKDQLSDKEIAAVINHERTSWGNNSPTVTVEQVAAVRKKEETDRI